MTHKLCHYCDTHFISGLEAIHLLGPGKKDLRSMNLFWEVIDLYSLMNLFTHPLSKYLLSLLKMGTWAMEGGMGGKASFRLQQRSQSVGRFLRLETWELEYEIILLMPEGRHGGSQESFLRRGLMKPIIQQPSHLRAWSRKSESIVQPELTFTAETGVNSFVLFLQEAGRPRHEEREGTDFQVSTTVTKLDNSILLLYYIWGSL